MFLFKKVVAPLFLPVSACLEIVLLGLILLWFSRRQRAGKIFVTVGFLLLGGLSLEAVSDSMLRPLEYRYPPVLDAKGLSDVKWVVVLGGGHTTDPKLPVTGQIGESSLARLVEGIRLHKMLYGSKLVLSGGGVFEPVSDAQVMADVAVALGVDRRALILETASRDTKDQAWFIKRLVGGDAFVLVTSASHMRRSVTLFQKQGMDPTPAPTDYRVKERQGFSPSMFFPSASNLRKAERAVYEYLGLLWARIRGQI